MTSTQIRQSFLDFFKSKQHTIVPSASLLPDSPNLLFTNAGMNQFVPIFLGQTRCPYTPGRATDTQKCIRAGGKHNDLDDVGLDTYHHTFFEMLGNWSFGDYFKAEAITWAWELVVDIWKFPPERLYATVYSPDQSKNDPSEFDQEAWNYWAGKFRGVGLDPAVHIVSGNKKDNFWMMGETGPCGPCSELHVDLTPDGKTGGKLVNQGDARCIEIWNLVFIQFNANPDGTFSPLPAKHVDTGMGFERVTSIIQGTKGLKDFANAKISNYETDIFRPIFDALEKLSGKKYGSTLPATSRGEHAPSRVPDRAPAVGTDARLRASSSGTTDAEYSRRNLPHFERPWAKYMVTFSTRERRKLTSPERDLVLKSILYAHEHRQCQIYAACVMPDHVHLLFEPQIKEEDKDGQPVFWSLSEILQGIKSASAHNINKTLGQTGHVWEQESMDRLIRGQSDLQEKFHYICRNPWDAGVAQMNEDYPWLWTPGSSEAHTGDRGEHAPSRVPDRALAVGTDARLRASSSSTADTQCSEPRAEARAGAVDEASTAAREARALPETGVPACAEETVKTAIAAQIQIDIAFRVIADHIRTLSFAIADGIQPGNNDRNYVLRRILRRAVRYGRTLGFNEPFFYKLVDVLAETMGEVFPEIRARKKQVQDTIRIEEEAFNKTLDKGIALFSDEVAKLAGSARVPRAVSGVAPETRSPNIPVAIESSPGSKYSKRNLPHFERPWGKYMVTFTTANRRQLSPEARDAVLESLLFTHHQRRWQLFAACVMPDHVHILFEPQIKEQDPDGNPIFWPLTELLHSVKSFTAHEINKIEGTTGGVWEKESFDRLMRSDADLEEKFHYICRNPWDNGAVPVTEPYKWLWTPGEPAQPKSNLDERTAPRDASQSTPEACAPQISGAFAFKLYDEQGFPLDLTELMARERGLTVDTEGFERLMEEQRARARAAQKKEVISLSQIETTTPTKFIGYDHLATEARVLEVVSLKDKTAVILDSSACYAEMGGQVGDTGELTGGGNLWRVTNTQKSGNTWLHFIETSAEDQRHEEDSRGAHAPSRVPDRALEVGTDARHRASSPRAEARSGAVDEASTATGEAPVLPIPGGIVTLSVDRARRSAIERHHTVTHLLHWALHEVASKEASQKGSFVGPDKLTFDFNSAPLTPAQVADIEKLVNERIVENAPVSWIEVPHAEVKSRKDVMQFFGDKYGDLVRVVQIGGQVQKLDGYSMELCGGTHTRATGEIGLFRIVGESAIAAGVRRIEAVAGLEAYGLANSQLQLIRSLAGKINSPVHELEKKVDLLLAHQKELDHKLKAAIQRNAAQTASWLLTRAQDVNGIPLITQIFPDADADYLQAIVDAVKGRFKGVVVVGGAAGGAVALIASVSPEFTAKVQAGKIIQAIAPVVGGKGGGKPDHARGGGKDPGKLEEALAKVSSLI